MKKIIILFVFIGLLFLTGCTSKDTTNNTKISNSLVGEYELFEVKGDGTTYSSKEWFEISTIKKTLVINKDKTAVIVTFFTNSTNGQTEQLKETYTYDNEAFYGVESDNTKEGTKYFTYNFKDKKLTLTVISDSHNSQYVFKKK